METVGLGYSYSAHVGPVSELEQGMQLMADAHILRKVQALIRGRQVRTKPSYTNLWVVRGSPTKEMMQPCLIYLHAISLVALSTRFCCPTKEMMQRASPHAQTRRPPNCSPSTSIGVSRRQQIHTHATSNPAPPQRAAVGRDGELRGWLRRRPASGRNRRSRTTPVRSGMRPKWPEPR